MTPPEQTTAEPLERRGSRWPAIFGFAAFLASLGIGIAFVRLGDRTRQSTRRQAIDAVARAQADALERQFERVFAAAFAVGASITKAGSDEHFATVAEQAQRQYPVIAALALGSGATILRRFPISAGYDVTQDPRAVGEIARAQKAGRFAIAGPLSGGRDGPLLHAFLALPESGASGDNGFGFVMATVRVADLVRESDFPGLAERGFDYQLVRSYGGREIVFARSTELDLIEPVRLAIAAPGTAWLLAIAPREGWQQSAQLRRGTTLVVVVSTLVGLMIFHLLRQPEVLQREVARQTHRLVTANRKVVQEVVERERAERQLLHDASHDSLTGLPNRAGFLGHVARALAEAVHDPQARFAVGVIALDRFSAVNDTFGPSVGDELITATARRIQRALRHGDSAARVGGEEFAVLLFHVAEPNDAANATRRIQAAVCTPLQLDGHDLAPTCSTGVALSALEYSQPQDLLRDASLAAQQAKARGDMAQVVFEPAMHDEAMQAQVIERDLRRALERDELRVYFEPVVSLSTGRITGFEALARWQHPVRGLLQPGSFVPIAESTGLVIPLDRWIWQRAAHRFKRLHAAKPEYARLSLSVNLSTRHLLQGDLTDEITRILEATGLSPSTFRVEITESAMLQNTGAAAQVLARLKELNIRLVLDDFGTGYSSFSYLHELPIDVLKVDRSFVTLLTSETKHTEIVRTIITLAHGLGMDVVAEGVEEDSQLRQLRSLGCGYAQGWLFSKPVSEDALDELLDSNRKW